MFSMAPQNAEGGEKRHEKWWTQFVSYLASSHDLKITDYDQVGGHVTTHDLSTYIYKTSLSMPSLLDLVPLGKTPE